MLNFRALFLLLFAALCTSTLFAQDQADRSLSPYFFVKSDQPALDQLPLKSTRAEVNIAGVIADVRVTQVYKNEGKDPVEAIYVFPGSTRAAVYGMQMQIGQRSITAEIKAREQARQEYQAAKASGQRASLLEQERPNVFQMNVANIQPGDEIKVILQYTELLVPTDGTYEFVYPGVVGPRYTGGSKAGKDAFAGQPYLKAGEAPTATFDIQVYLSTAMPLQSVKCTSHPTDINFESLKTAVIDLKKSEQAGGNRDYILHYRLAGGQIESGLMRYEHDSENYFLMMVQPPACVEESQIPPREYLFIIDVSGSMNGFPIDISKKLMRDLLVGLRPDDRFNILLFASSSSVLASQSLPVNPENIRRATNFIDNPSGSGGTNLLPALKRALALPRHSKALSRSIVVVTDGYVTVEQEAFDLIRNNLHQANLFAFGIGSSINRHLIEGMAHVGQGEPLIITKPEEAHEKAERFRQYISSPVLTQVKVDFEGFEAIDVQPSSVPDVLAERPVIIFGKYQGNPQGQIRLRGYSGDRQFEKIIDVADSRGSIRNTALRYLWAREKIRLLDDYNQLQQSTKREAEITKLGLQYNLMTAYTSFLAVDREKTNNQPLTKVNQPLPLPSGVNNSAVGFDLAIEGLASQISDGPTVTLPAAAVETAVRPAPPTTLGQRSDITFILGEDDYYRAAADYYRSNPQERTELVITHCRSLLDIRNYLEQYRPSNQLAWGRVNIVVHSNEWSDMNMAVLPEGKRANTHRIQQAVASGQLKALGDAIVDAHTELIIQACALGRNTRLLEAISKALGGEDVHRPMVRSSRYFVGFGEGGGRQLSEFWYAFYKSGYRPGDIRLSNQLRQRYPDAGVDWREALRHQQPKALGDVYHYSFRVPIAWTVTYERDELRPRLETPEAQRAWLAQQGELQDLLASYGLPNDKIQWTVQRVRHWNEDGSRSPAIKVIGSCTIVCILRTLIEENSKDEGSAAPLMPAYSDPRYYGGSVSTY